MRFFFRLLLWAFTAQPVAARVTQIAEDGSASEVGEGHQPSRLLSLLLPRLRSAEGFQAPLAPRAHARTTRAPAPVSQQNEDRGAGFIANAAVVAATEVAKAVDMRPIEAPDVSETFVAMSDEDSDRIGKVDEVGLPLVYNREAIQKYWEKEGSALQERWGEFTRLSVPFLTRLVTLLLKGGGSFDELNANAASLATDARIIMEKLGPTYVKLGQTLSVRPDVLPQAAIDELAILQDSVKPFETSIAIETIESELGKPLGEVFEEISTDPVAAASLAQVYKGRIKGTGEEVAIKVQRPAVLEVVSKDLYVLRRAAEVYQGLVDRFAPQQNTDAVALLNEWAVGFYTELDFVNEGNNQMRMKELLASEGKEGKDQIYVPKVYKEYSSRRLLVTEWVDGIKLSECPPDEIRDLIAIGQESFLTQLLQIGFFHADPHPGNIMKMADTSKGRLALIDFGLMATIEQGTRDTMVSAIVHLANKDYAALVDDFIKLDILPPDTDRSTVEPLMDKALTPYVRGGGAKKYEEELRGMYGMGESVSSKAQGFQAITQDLLTVLNEVPFGIPPYFALLARAVLTLEGIALIGNPDYSLVLEAYPFVARKLLSEDRPEIQKALAEVLYGGGPGSSIGEELKGQRLASIINNAMGAVAKTSDAFVDLDALPEDGVNVRDALAFLLSDKAESLRNLLEDEVVTAADLLGRQAGRRAFSNAINRLPSVPFLPRADKVPSLFFVPPEAPGGQPRPTFVAPEKVLDALSPPPSREEELYALSILDLARVSLGEEATGVLSGDALERPERLAALVLGALATVGSTAGTPQPLVDAAAQIRDLLERAQPGLSQSENANVRELVDGLQELDEEQKATLNEYGRRILRRLYDKLADRAQTLTPAR